MTFEGETGFQLFRNIFTVVMTLAMMASLTEFRFSKRKLAVMFILYLLWVGVSCGALLLLGGQDLLLRVFLLTVSAPAVALTYWAAKDTPSQAVFNYMSQITVSLLAAAGIHLLTQRFGLSKGADILLRCAFYLPAIYLERRFLRRPFRELVTVLPSWWGILPPIPCAFCVYIVFVGVWPVSYLDSPVQTTYLYAAALLLAVVYISGFRSLSNQYKIQMERQNAALMEMQVSALRKQLQAAKRAEESLRIVRHDMRHHLQTVAILVERGETAAAMEVLGAARKNLNETQVAHWCREPVLDAVLSYYFRRAEEQGIRVQAELSFPEVLPVDINELSTVFANALENAIRACAALPEAERQIRCRVIHRPQLMVQIANTFKGEVRFDRDGLPETGTPGHGIGTRSIAAFCRKHGACCSYEARDGWFTLQMIVDRSGKADMREAPAPGAGRRGAASGRGR